MFSLWCNDEPFKAGIVFWKAAKKWTGTRQSADYSAAANTEGCLAGRERRTTAQQMRSFLFTSSSFFPVLA